MRVPARLRLFLLSALMLCSCSLVCQTTGSPTSTVPTTKVLAIGTLVSPLTPEQWKAIMPREVPDTVELYLHGRIDQWYVRKDNKGVVFLMNVSSASEAQDLLERLPLGQAKLMKFELIELGPLSPLRMLLPASQ